MPYQAVVDPYGDSYIEVCCPKSKSAQVCCMENASIAVNVYQLSVPDLSSTTVDGPVDHGVSYLKVTMPDAGDNFQVAVKGRVAMKGAVCPAPSCPLQVLLVQLTPVPDNLVTAKGRQVANLLARNLNTWRGDRAASGAITLDSHAQIGIQGILDGEEQAVVLRPNAYFQGKLIAGTLRNTGTSQGMVQNNRLEIDGDFSNDQVHATFHIRTWLADCSPKVFPRASCVPDIESGRPPHLHLDSDFEMLANLNASVDLCAAMLADKTDTVCTPGKSSNELAPTTFFCQRPILPPPGNKVEIAKRLDFLWEDAAGTVLGKTFQLNPGIVPVFPVTLTVKNEWGKKASGTITVRPPCVPATFGSAQGKISFLRVHTPGSGYGAPPDFLDTEVIVRLNGSPDLALGLPLGSGGNPAYRTIFKQVRDAFEAGTEVLVEYERTGPHTGKIFRVAALPQ